MNLLARIRKPILTTLSVGTVAAGALLLSSCTDVYYGGGYGSHGYGGLGYGSLGYGYGYGYGNVRRDWNRYDRWDRDRGEWKEHRKNWNENRHDRWDRAREWKGDRYNEFREWRR